MGPGHGVLTGNSLQLALHLKVQDLKTSSHHFSGKSHQLNVEEDYRKEKSNEPLSVLLPLTLFNLFLQTTAHPSIYGFNKANWYQLQNTLWENLIGNG